MKTLLLLSFVVAVSLALDREKECLEYIRSLDEYFLNPQNFTTIKKVIYDAKNGRGTIICPTTLADPTATDLPPTIILRENATEVCEYVTIILLDTNTTNKRSASGYYGDDMRYAPVGLNSLMWVVANARTEPLTRGDFGEQAVTIVPYKQPTTTDEQERFYNGDDTFLKGRIFGALCQPGYIPREDFDIQDRRSFKPKEFQRKHGLGEYAAFYHEGLYTLPNETLPDDAEARRGRSLCNDTGSSYVCTCVPLALLRPDEGLRRCFLPVEVPTEPPGLMGGSSVGGGAEQPVDGEMPLLEGVMEMVGGAMGGGGGMLG